VPAVIQALNHVYWVKRGTYSFNMLILKILAGLRTFPVLFSAQIGCWPCFLAFWLVLGVFFLFLEDY